MFVTAVAGGVAPVAASATLVVTPIALALVTPGEPHIRLRHFCSLQHRDSALYPFIARLERAAGFEREDDAAARLDKLEALNSDS